MGEGVLATARDLLISLKAGVGILAGFTIILAVGVRALGVTDLRATAGDLAALAGVVFLRTGDTWAGVSSAGAAGTEEGEGEGEGAPARV